ncbi:MAG TPA: hypothetical protein VFX16_08615 [Pseudonocardiaceae bacterium]|nr:hypothetical protein [Pseudonocardiaceae bacterium]
MIGLRGIASALATWVVLTFAFVKLVGTPVGWSILIALPLAAVLLLLLSTPVAIEPAWGAPPEPPSAAAHLDASTLANRLEDAVADQGRYRSRVQPRLAALALSSLRRRPGLADVLDLSDPRAVTVLGDRWHTLLTDPSATLPEPHVLLALLARLEEQ